MSAVRIGVSLPSHGPAMPGGRLSAPDAARAAEQMGFDSVWMSDHVVMVEGAASPYPFAEDAKITWPEDAPMFDCFVALAAAGAVTSRVEVGTCVLIAPQRNPIVAAKQAATLDALTGGRLVLGVGVGWLAEEFAALGAPFEGRGKRLDEWIALFRDCWTGPPRRPRLRALERAARRAVLPDPGGRAADPGGGDGAARSAPRRALGRGVDGFPIHLCGGS